MQFSQWLENTSKFKTLEKALDHPDFYARDLESIKRETGFSDEEIKNLTKDKSINIFSFGGTEYIGTDDRKKVYDKDKEIGINPFELDTYKGDKYREKVLNGMPRFRQNKK